jgi:lysophospholipase L1-like esterase
VPAVHEWAEWRAPVEALTARLRGLPLAQARMVFLGDSITQGWGDDFSGAFPGLKAANRGISGDTTRGMLVRLKEDVLDLSPAAVVLLMGTNDLEEKASPETIAANAVLLLDALKAHRPDLPIFLCEVFPASASKSRPAASIKAINDLYRKAASSRPQVTLVPTYALFANASGDTRGHELNRLIEGAKQAYELGLRVNAGHGLNYQNVRELFAVPHLEELNIGHAIISRALITGLATAVKEMKSLCEEYGR